MRTVHIHIEGQVQGVGFRPFVFRLATELSLYGWVNNGVDGVHIEAEGQDKQIETFIRRAQQEVPAVARITKFSVQDITKQQFKEFEIVESKAEGITNLLITPDIGLCDICRTEIHDAKNHRYQYPFTTCTHCGPRYSILKSLPYDRPTTTMNTFMMCSRCKEEYNNPLDRRYYSQTNSCPDCAIPAWMLNSTGEKIANSWEESFPLLINALKEGKIIAMKGIGGYLLLVDACNAEAIQTLRGRKHRPTKPFALMYPDLETLKQDAEVNEQEAKEFTSIQSPIVLLKLKSKPTSGIYTALIAPALDTIGAMQPYTAMFDLLMHEWKKPLIATSANVSGSPILYKDESAIQALSTIADYFLVHNREIEIAQDDSVVKFTPEHKQRIVLRRSRGFAPTILRDAFSNETILALGADMKSAFSLQANGRIYTSQFLGDLESYESQESFRATLHHLLNLVKAKPDRIIIDAHPNYYSSQLGQQLAVEWGVPVQKVQHHKAHACAVLAENDLLYNNYYKGCHCDPPSQRETSGSDAHLHEQVLCVVWDGTGYGDDKNIWGGEFFEYDNGTIIRIGQVDYTPVWQGDRMAKDARLAAFFYGHNSERVQKLLVKKFSEIAWLYYTKLIHITPALHTSSIGRLFDAVACLTGLNDFNLFEGESAMRLEKAAAFGRTAARYPVKWKNTCLDVEDVLEHIITDIENNVRTEEIAFKFHAYLADVIRSIVESKGYKKGVFSGGVFQNTLLADLIWNQLNGYELFFHRELSPNDENISFGQLAFVTQTRTEREKKSEKELITNPI